MLGLVEACMALTPGASTDSNTASTPESKLKMAEASDAPFMCLSARPVVPTTDTTSPRNMRSGRILRRFEFRCEIWAEI